MNHTTESKANMHIETVTLLDQLGISEYDMLQAHGRYWAGPVLWGKFFTWNIFDRELLGDASLLLLYLMMPIITTLHRLGIRLFMDALLIFIYPNSYNVYYQLKGKKDTQE